MALCASAPLLAGNPAEGQDVEVIAVEAIAPDCYEFGHHVADAVEMWYGDELDASTYYDVWDLATGVCCAVTGSC